MNYEQAQKFFDQLEWKSKPADKKEAYQSSPILVYGAGNVGHQIFESLTQKNIRVTAFLDRNASEGQSVLNVPVYRPDDSSLTEQMKAEATVLLAVFLPPIQLAKIKDFLLGLGYCNVLVKYNLICPYLVFLEEENAKDAIKALKAPILEAMTLMSDEHSCDVFCSNLRAHAAYEYEQAIVSEEMEQYFDVKVPFSKGFSNFVDCGAFTGDSLEKLLKYHKLEHYYAFEPDSNNYQRLQKTVDLFAEQMKSALLFPCGVSEANAFLSFQSGNHAASAISEQGDSIVQVVALDQVLKKAPVSMIKMDIEGVEQAAIRGAQEILKTQKPDLCICVYHKIADMWEIPLLLKSIVPEYKFYMRCHNSLTMETVLYATV